MGLAGLGAIARGINTGIDEGLDDRRRAKQEQRDDERFQMEKDENDEKRRQLAARKQLSDELQQTNSDWASGSIHPSGQQDASNGDPDGSYAAVENKRLGIVTNDAAQTLAPPAPAPAPAPVAAQPDQPVVQGPAATDAGAGRGIVNPPAAQPPADAPPPPPPAPHEPGGVMWADRKYADPTAAREAYYQRIQGSLEKYYAVADPTKLASVPSEVAKLRDGNYDQLRQKAVAGLALGAPGAMANAAKLYDMIDDQRHIDPSTGTFDPKTQTWNGVQIVDAKGNRTEMSIGPAQIALIGSTDPAKAVQMNLENSIAERKVSATEQAAKGALLTGEAHRDNVGVAQTANRLTAQERDDRARAVQRERNSQDFNKELQDTVYGKGYDPTMPPKDAPQRDQRAAAAQAIFNAPGNDGIRAKQALQVVDALGAGKAKVFTYNPDPTRYAGVEFMGQRVVVPIDVVPNAAVPQPSAAPAPAPAAPAPAPSRGIDRSQFRVSPAEQAARDRDAGSILSDELAKAEQRYSSASDPVVRSRAAGDVLSLKREISRRGVAS